MKDISFDLYNGKIYKAVSKFWFTALGYVAAIVTMELVAKSVDSFSILIVAKLSYFVLLLWLMLCTNHVIWWLKPDLNPELNPDLRVGGKKIRKGSLWRVGKISGSACAAVYFFIEHIVDTLIAFQYSNLG